MPETAVNPRCDCGRRIEVAIADKDGTLRCLPCSTAWHAGAVWATARSTERIVAALEGKKHA